MPVSQSSGHLTCSGEGNAGCDDALNGRVIGQVEEQHSTLQGAVSSKSCKQERHVSDCKLSKLQQAAAGMQELSRTECECTTPQIVVSQSLLSVASTHITTGDSCEAFLLSL